MVLCQTNRVLSQNKFDSVVYKPVSETMTIIVNLIFTESFVLEALHQTILRVSDGYSVTVLAYSH